MLHVAYELFKILCTTMYTQWIYDCTGLVTLETRGTKTKKKKKNYKLNNRRAERQRVDFKWQSRGYFKEFANNNKCEIDK